jgi:hypothetical protein
LPMPAGAPPDRPTPDFLGKPTSAVDGGGLKRDDDVHWRIGR